MADDRIIDRLRALEVGESHSIMFRCELKKYARDDVLAQMKKLNNSVGAIASRAGNFAVERVTTMNNGATHVIYGLVITREK